MASLEGHVKWETAEGRWVGESDAGNTVTFLTAIRFQNHELALSYLATSVCLPNMLLGLRVSVE